MVKEPPFRRLLPCGKMPQALLIGGFAVVILGGTLLPLLPWSQTKGEVGFCRCTVHFHLGCLCHRTGGGGHRRDLYSVLIVLGGWGHMVFLEVWHHGKNQISGTFLLALTFIYTHSRVVLRTTLALILVGWLGLLLLGLVASEATWGIKLSAALFQSVTARIAGVNTVDIGVMPLASLLLSCQLLELSTEGKKSRYDLDIAVIGRES